MSQELVDENNYPLFEGVINLAKEKRQQPMKTAMQELIDNLEAIDIKVPIGVKLIFFEKEKEQIKRAFEFGVADAYNFIEDEAEEYYNQTYIQNK